MWSLLVRWWSDSWKEAISLAKGAEMRDLLATYWNALVRGLGRESLKLCSLWHVAKRVARREIDARWHSADATGRARIRGPGLVLVDQPLSSKYSDCHGRYLSISCIVDVVSHH